MKKIVLASLLSMVAGLCAASVLAHPVQAPHGHPTFSPNLCNKCGFFPSDGARVGFNNSGGRLALSLVKPSGCNDGTNIGAVVSSHGFPAQKIVYNSTNTSIVDLPYVFFSVVKPNQGIEKFTLFAGGPDSEVELLPNGKVKVSFFVDNLVPNGSIFQSIKLFDQRAPINIDIFSILIDGVAAVPDATHGTLHDCGGAQDCSSCVPEADTWLLFGALGLMLAGGFIARKRMQAAVA